MSWIMALDMHCNKKTTAVTVPAAPFFNVGVELLPSTKVEVTHAEIGAVGYLDGFPSRGKERLVNVVKYPRHSSGRIIDSRESNKPAISCK
jgi:hypothetical protein